MAPTPSWHLRGTYKDTPMRQGKPLTHSAVSRVRQDSASLHVASTLTFGSIPTPPQMSRSKCASVVSDTVFMRYCRIDQSANTQAGNPGW